MRNDYTRVPLGFNLSSASKHKTLKPLFVFTYHSIAPDADKPFQSIPYFDLRVKPEIFEVHLRYYQKKFTVIGERELISLEFPESNKPYGLLTFDDGYADNYRYAFPLLCKYKVPAIFFPVLDAIERNEILWDNLFLETAFYFPEILKKFYFEEMLKTPSENRFSKPGKTAQENITKQAVDFLKYRAFSQSEINKIVSGFVKKCCYEIPNKNRYYTVEQCLEMKKSGLINFGSHTCSHAILTHSQEYESEITESKKRMEAFLQTEVNSFCYPSGNFDQKVIDMLNKSGYKLAFTVQTGTNNLNKMNHFTLHRFHICEWNTHRLRFELSKLKSWLTKQ